MADSINARSLTKSSFVAPATPTGAQSVLVLRARRWFVFGLNAVTYLALAAAMATVMSAGGWSLVDAIMFIAFLVASPWTVLGFWNALIGLALLLRPQRGLASVMPLVAAGRDDRVHVRTAILLTLRNEDPDRAIARLRAVKASIDSTGFGERFAYFILSDTSDADVARAEEAAASAWARADRSEIVYRRRADNAGYKAGNLRDFCRRWGAAFDLMLPLDADSLMSGETIVDLVRVMQAHPKLGTLQSLVVGMPSSSAFARIFQFGMRHGMRPYTMGNAWWNGDCGPFWGHNALVRIAPFRDHCDLPILPGKALGGHVLSHDQVEATLMRRAGFEVRVLPVECGSWEENPPTVLEFVRRDLRWCLGNMQYVHLLRTPGLLPTSRFQLLWAILMFVGLPAWTLMIALLPFAVIEGNAVPGYPAGTAIAVYLAFMVMYLMPKIAGVLDVLFANGVVRYGGVMRFAAAVLIELLFAFLQGAVSTFRTTLFMIGLPFGRARTGWSGQARDAYRLSWRTACAGLWPHLLFGLYVCGSLALFSPTVLLWALPLVAGYVLAIPFAVVTASPALGAWFARHRLCGIPEEFDTPAIIRAVAKDTPDAR